MNKKERFKQITNQLFETYEKKNADYGDSFSKSVEEFGLLSPVIRIGDKYNRIKNLVKSKIDEPLVTGETVEDTLLDLANYCILTVIEMESLKEKVGVLYKTPFPYLSNVAASPIDQSYEKRTTISDFRASLNELSTGVKK